MFDPVLLYPKYTIRMTTTALAAGQAIKICDAEPRRICLTISRTSVTGNIRILPEISTLVTRGIRLDDETSLRIFPYSHDPGLCQAAWWGVSEGGIPSAYVVETLFDPNR